jgi:hypothetical protein
MGKYQNADQARYRMDSTDKENPKHELDSHDTCTCICQCGKGPFQRK